MRRAEAGRRRRRRLASGVLLTSPQILMVQDGLAFSSFAVESIVATTTNITTATAAPAPSAATADAIADATATSVATITITGSIRGIETR